MDVHVSSIDDELATHLTRTLKVGSEVSVTLIAHNYSQALELCERVNLLQHDGIMPGKLVRLLCLERREI